MISALLEMQFADRDKVSNYQCSKCTEKIKKLRRCQEDRWDFTPEDASFWPIILTQGGEQYGFCPGKCNWDSRLINWFISLRLTAETGHLHYPGPISQQPFWYVELVSHFTYLYNEFRFYQRAKAILGDGKKTGVSHGNIKGLNRSKNHRK